MINRMKTLVSYKVNNTKTFFIYPTIRKKRNINFWLNKNEYYFEECNIKKSECESTDYSVYVSDLTSVLINLWSHNLKLYDLNMYTKPLKGF